MINKTDTINIFPFGVIYEERFNIAKKYKLVENVSGVGIWRLTKKCKDNYDEVSFYHYLQGRVEIAKRKNKQKEREKEIQALLSL